MSTLSPAQVNELIAFLNDVELFKKVDESELRWLIEEVEEVKEADGKTTIRPKYLAQEFKKPGQELFRQSDSDGLLRILYKGTLRLLYIDPEGTPSTVGERVGGLRVGEQKEATPDSRVLGEASLFLAEPHDVTAVAVTEVTSLVFKRDTFMSLQTTNPRLWGRLNLNQKVADRLAAPRFDWLDTDELVIHFTREHWWGLMRRMFFPLLALLAMAGFMVLVNQALPTLLWLAVVISLLVVGGIVTYFVVDWRNDFWVVTTKRIVHVDELVMIRKKRQETPLPSVTQVQFERHGMAAAIFDFGDLEVETFTGTIGMRDIPTPMYIKQEISEEIEKSQALARAAGRKTIRDDLQKRIILKDETPAGLQKEKKEEAPAPPARPSYLTGIFRYFFPKLMSTEGDTTVWRKHWVELWRHEIWSTLALSIGVASFLNWYAAAPPIGVLLEDGAWWIWPLILGGLGAWWWWIFEDWRNDEYILTGTRVLEINRTPFALNEQRRESALSDFQSTELRVVGPWQKLFKYGTLIIKLPGAQVEFKHIANPAGAQIEIQKRLSAFKAKQAATEAQSRRNEMSDWFAAYDEIRQRDRMKDTAAGPPPSGPAANPSGQPEPKTIGG